MQVQETTAAYSIEEEIAQSVAHGIGLLMGVIGLPTLIMYASKYGDVWHIVINPAINNICYAA
jgi:hemolysin III